MTANQFQTLMSRLAADSALKQTFVEQSGTPTARQQVQLMQQAEERLAATLRQAFAHHNRET